MIFPKPSAKWKLPKAALPPLPRVEVLCVGTELLSGKINTHLSYFSRVLREIGLEISRETTLPDNQKEIQEALRNSLLDSDIVIFSGGLGPTFDDVTREGVAEALKRKLRLDRKLLRSIEKKFLRYQLPMPESNKRQAYLIEGAKILENRWGSAPGQLLTLKTKNGKSSSSKPWPTTLVLLPGPSRELKPMVEKEVLPWLRKTYCPDLYRKTLALRLVGIMESEVDEKIRPILARVGEGLEFTILAESSCVDLYATAFAADSRFVDYTLDKVSRAFYQVLGNWIYGKGEETLEGVVGQELRKQKKTLAVAESCTGGMLASRITNVPGSSDYFLGGVVCYSNEVKVKNLGVQKKTIQREGAVSAACAQQMAQGVRHGMGATWGLAVTGIAGPTGGTSEKPTGLVYIALSGPGLEKVEKNRFLGDRSQVRARVTFHALNLVRLALRK